MFPIELQTLKALHNITSINNEPKTAVYAGSFDPLTNGHLWVIDSALKIFDKLIIVIASNSNKKPIFSEEERFHMIYNIIFDNRNTKSGVEIDFLHKNIFLADYCKMKNINFIIRGIRNISDMEYENSILEVNNSINPSLTTLFLIPPKSLCHISSSIVKELISVNSMNSSLEIKKYVPSSVFEKIESRIKNKKVDEDFVFITWKNSIIKVCNSFIVKDYDNLINFTYNKIYDMYNQNNRYYHNMKHIEKSLMMLDKFKSFFDNVTEEDIAVLNIALFFHDCEYNSLSTEHEIASSKKALEILYKFSEVSNISYRVVNKIQQLIVSTKYEGDSNEKKNILFDIMREIDFSILASPINEYEEYKNNIYSEFLNPLSSIKESFFYHERLKFIHKILSVKTFFKVLPGSNLMNSAMKKNLEREKKELKKYVNISSI